MRKVFGMSVLALVFGLFISFNGYSETKVMKVGTTNAKVRAQSKALVKFGEIVEKNSKGAIKVEVYTDGVLGGNRQMVEACQMGALQGTIASAGVVGAFVPRMEIFDFPYLFKDEKVARTVLDGAIGKEFLADLPAVKLVGLSFWENGYRNLTNSKKAVKTADDMKGLKVRTTETAVHVAFWKLLGVNPTPMAITQVYTALEQKVVDGQENPYANIIAYKFNEVQKYVTATEHVYGCEMFIVSKVFMDSLTPAERTIITEAADEAKVYERNLVDQETKEGVGALTKAGMTYSVLNPGEKEKIQKLLKPIYDEYGKKYPNKSLEKVVAAAKAAEKK